MEDMEQEVAGQTAEPGLIASVRRLGETMLAIVQNRVELIAVELQEEKARAINLLIWTVIGVFLAVMALVVATFTIVYLMPEDARGKWLIGFTLFYIAAAAVAFVVVRNQIKKRPPPFSETISQIKKDRAWLKSRN